MSSKAFDEWAAAHRELAEAEIAIVRWQLHEGDGVPPELTDKVEELRDRVAFLFEVASAHMASPHDTGPAEL